MIFLPVVVVVVTMLPDLLAVIVFASAAVFTGFACGLAGTGLATNGLVTFAFIFALVLAFTVLVAVVVVGVVAAKAELAINKIATDADKTDLFTFFILATFYKNSPRVN